MLLLSSDLYEKEVLWQLSDTFTYSKLSLNPFPALVVNINLQPFLVREANLMTNKEWDYLGVGEFNNPTFYIIPKLHKSLTSPTGRPIVSTIGGPLERLGRYIDGFIKTMVSSLLSFVQDTCDVHC